MDLPATATSTQGAASLLRQRLAPQSWPLAIEQLPPGCALVGGAVRDGLLDRLPPHPDLDLVVPTGAIALARQLAKAHRGVAVVLDAPRDMARVVLGPWTIDLAACAGSSLVEDLHRRDYRINAMALPLGLMAPCWIPSAAWLIWPRASSLPSAKQTSRRILCVYCGGRAWRRS